METKTKTMQVIMLPTDKETTMFLSDDKQSMSRMPMPTKSPNGVHLNIISDAKIKKGDWFITDDRISKSHNNGVPNWILLQCNSITNKWIESNSRKGEGFNPDWAKKIEATTDSSLGQLVGSGTDILQESIPQIPQSFIEAYVKSNGTIKEVQVEIDEFINPDDNDDINTNYIKIKTRPDNTIIIHSTKTYTREEVINLLTELNNDSFRNGIQHGNKPIIDRWIKNKL